MFFYFYQTPTAEYAGKILYPLGFLFLSEKGLGAQFGIHLIHLFSYQKEI